MKILKSSVEIVDQAPGIEGMKKHIERVGRIAYKSEGLITPDSYLRFVDMLYKRGHWAVFNLGTVYLKVPKAALTTDIQSLLSEPFTKYDEVGGFYYITTNYRVICQLGLEELMVKYWEEPCKNHYHRITSHWICSRSTSHQVVRHRALCIVGDSEVYSVTPGLKWKIEDLYEWMNSPTSGLLGFMDLASVNEESGLIYATKIKDVIQSGRKSVYRVVTELGNELISTKAHQYYVGGGEYKTLSKLSVGDSIYSYLQETNEVKKDKIVSIESCGRKMCYDLEVVGPYHNFVASGVVVHNCAIQESQRYVNYDKSKNGGGIQYIHPQWAYRVREDIGTTIDSLTGEVRSWVLDLDGEELWHELSLHDRTVAGRDRLWELIENEYRYEVNADDGEKLKPEEARGVLCNDTKTELCLCGYLSDWMYEPDPEKTTEKAGFFYLRCAQDAQEDIRVLAQSLKYQFIERGFDKLK